MANPPKTSTTDDRDPVEEAVEQERQRCIDIIAAHCDIATDPLTKHLLIRLINLIAIGTSGS